MPSPEHPSDPAHSSHPTPLSNGAGSSAIQNGSIRPDPSPVRDSTEAILQGKQRAKAVMAASGINIASNPPASSSSSTATTSPTLDATADAQPSRKRSRSGSRIPQPSATSTQTASDKPRPTTKQLLLEQYVTRDQLNHAAILQQNLARDELWSQLHMETAKYTAWRREGVRDPSIVYGRGFVGYGNGTTNSKPAVLYPAQRKRPNNRKSKELVVARKDRTAQAEQVEELVPIRLDLEFEKLRLRDTFTWNLHDRVVTPELFAETLIEDFRIPPEASFQLLQQVYTHMSEQINDFHPHLFIPDNESPAPSLPYSAYKNDDMRIVVRLNITIGQFTLVDQFEWDMNNPINSPEEFARQMAADMSLPGEFTTAIAHSIREQTQAFTKGLYISAHPFDGRPVEDSDIKEGLQPSPLISPFRTFQSAKDYSPLLYELNESDLERTEHTLLREQRAIKRSVNRRGGPSMPDLKDRQRTVRTMVVSSVLPGASDTVEGSGLYKISRSASGRGRRPGRADRGEDSDESESELSETESTGPNSQGFMSQGTARTRGMRGAASAAQAAMRATYGRSATPELAMHHHETRTSARKVGGYDGREDSVDSPTFIVKLRLPRNTLRRLEQEWKSGRSHSRGAFGEPHGGTPQRGSLPPTSTPNPPAPRPSPGQSQNPHEPSNQLHQRVQSHDRPAGSPTPPAASTTTAASPPPPPPAVPTWVKDALTTLHARWPDDSFDAVMRWAPEPGRYVPKMKCNDCPAKTYTIPKENPMDNFELHLRNRQHVGKVEARLGRKRKEHTP